MRRSLVAVVLGIAATSLFAHDPISTKVTWEREIKPLVEARCVSCHAEGGRAPMPLTTYEEARPWARAIREEVLTRRMPKWQVVRGYGDFTNDRSLSPFEIALFAAWADGGAPKTLPAKPGSGVSPVPVEPTIIGRRADGTKGETAGRSIDVPCTTQRFPIGRAVALKPVLAEGADLRVTVTHADGSQEPLLWLKKFDPDFAETYRLRRPLDVTRATRVSIEGAAPCRITLWLESKTAR